MSEWKTLSKKLVLENGKYLKVENHKIQLHDGSIIENWPWIILPDFINIVAVTPDGKFICFSQNKYAYKGTAIATVGGYIEPGETPLEAAKRELLEETGYESKNWISLGDVIVDANRYCNEAFFYLAKDAVKITEPIKDDLEEQEILFLNKKEIVSALENNEIKILSWAYAISRALNYFENEK